MVGVGIHEISFLILAAFSGYALGNLLVSFTDGKIDMQIVIVASMAAVAMTNALAPWLTSLWLLCLCLFLNGIAGGLVEAADIAYILHLWGDESHSFLQVIDFLYGVGSILGPSIAKPFLIEENLVNSTKPTLGPDDLELQYPYSIIAVYCTLIAVMFSFAYLYHRRDAPHASRVEDDSRGKCRKIDPKLKYLVLVLVCLLYLLTNGMAMIIETFISSYIVHSAHVATKATGALMVMI